MQISKWLPLAIVLGAGPAEAAITAVLESPNEVASEVSNIQGWAFTTTPGASLTPPFKVYVDGDEVLEIPCCGARADVREVHPDAPLATGFLIAASGFAVATIGLCLELCEGRADDGWVGSLAATGRLALTHYLAHTAAILMLLMHVSADGMRVETTIGLGLVFFVAAVAFSRAWSRRWTQGPLEGLLRQVTRAGIDSRES